MIVLEGINGTGTTTQCNILKERFKDSVICRFPGGTNLGKELRKILKFSSHKIEPQVELMLFAADALSSYHEIIQNSDKLIICDRVNVVGMFTYQLAKGACEYEIIETLLYLKNMGWKCVIDKLFIFLADYDLLLRRLENPNLIEEDKNEGNKKDRFESSGDRFMRKVLVNYQLIANGKYGDLLKRHGFVKNIITVDASKTIEEVTKFLLQFL